MTPLLTLLNWLLPLAYLALLINYGITFFLRTRAHERNLWLLPAIGLHALFLAMRSARLGHPPLDNNYDILTFLALATAVAYCVVEFAVRDRRTGMFVLLPVFMFQYTSSVFLSGTFAAGAAMASGEGFSWVRVHTVPAIMAYTGFTLAAVYGMLHLSAQRNLKEHRIGAIFERLPSLDLLGHMSWYALVFGFVFITIVVASGPFLFSHEQAAGAGGVLNPKVGIKIFVGGAAWVIYGVAVVGKLVGKWPARRISRIAAYGFLAIMVVLVGSILLS
jgi:ABC-type uncharacterized transport system permease subunit